jgi:ribonuclease HI
MYGKELVQQGLRWGIGNGLHARILEDNWIPDVVADNLRPLIPLPRGATVSYLMDADTGSWDADMVRGCFENSVARKILQIPLSCHGGDDFPSWPHAKCGIYTVLQSDMTGEEKLWKKLWNIKAPGKMKITLWRLAHDCLPSGFQLRQRNIPAEETCNFCNRMERAEHSVLFCPYAAEVWRAVKAAYPVHLRRKHFVSPKYWVLDFLGRSNDREAMILAVSVWHLWEARNAVRNDEKRKHPNSLAEQIKAYIALILLHLFKPTTIHSRDSTSTSPQWSPQPEGTAIVNVDAALFSSSSRMGVGVVIRDHSGKFLVACSKLLDEVIAPELAEALAVRSAITLALEEGLDRIILVSDCLSVIQRIQSPNRDRSLVGVVVEDIKTFATSLSSVTFRHISRRCNNSAHTMARRAELVGSCLFRVFAPECIRDKLCFDVI